MDPAPTSTPGRLAWWRLLNGYQWYVFLLAAFGWLFDCFDQQIFTMSRSITMRDLLPGADTLTQTTYGGYATSIFIIGWATGGLIFGMMGDRWGRAKTMAVTILVYAACTGLSGLAQSWSYFAVFRFLAGAGVGGEFAVGAALVAEVMPDKARPHALGSLQALSAIGNILAALSLGIVVPEQKLGWGWRGLYYLGALPGLVAVMVFWRLKEPERWVQARAKVVASRGREQMGRISELFTHPVWRRNTLVGLCLAIAGVLGLWGVGFYSPELIDSAIPTVEIASRPKFEALIKASTPEAHLAGVQALNAKETQKYHELLNRIARPGQPVPTTNAVVLPLTDDQKGQLRPILERAIPEDNKTYLKSIGGMLQQVGAFLGMSCFTYMATRFGRRRSFFFGLLGAWASLILVFTTFQEAGQVYYLWPILGFFTLAPFGGYAIYFPELFPTRLRTTGTSFCYNVGRYVAALGPFALGPLARALHGMTPLPGFRLAAMILAGSYLVGLVALIWAPETQGRPLPEDAPAEKPA